MCPVKTNDAHMSDPIIMIIAYPPYYLLHGLIDEIFMMKVVLNCYPCYVEEDMCNLLMGPSTCPYSNKDTCLTPGVQHQRF